MTPEFRTAFNSFTSCVVSASFVVLAQTTFQPAEAFSRGAPNSTVVGASTENPNLGDLDLVQLLEDVGGAERINFSGKLRMLTQRLAASACNLHAGVAPDDSLVLLSAASAEFEKIVKGLEFGDADLGIIGAEERRKTLVVIKSLNESWSPFHDALKTLQSDPSNAEAMSYISKMNMPLLERAKLLVSEMVTQYTNPVEMLQSDAMAIDIAGRQRMLTQKMSKEACAVASGNAELGNSDALAGTMGIFETSLFALRDGMPAAGLNPPRTPEIAEQVGVVVSHWDRVKAQLEPVTAGATIDTDARAEIMTGLNATMKDMNAAVGLYTEAAKLGL